MFHAILWILACQAAVQVPPAETPASPPPKTAPELGFKIGYDRGMRLETADPPAKLRIYARIDTDFRDYLQGPDDFNFDGFLVRRARIGLEGSFDRDYEGRLMLDFTTPQDPIRDAFLNIRSWDCFQIEGGKFKPPFSYEFLLPSGSLPMMERSILQQVATARQIGLMLHGKELFENQLDYGVAVTTGQEELLLDDNDQMDLDVRVAWRPFAATGHSWLKGLQFGAAGTWGIQERQLLLQIIRTPDRVPFLFFLDGVEEDGPRNRYNLEAAYFNGPLGFSFQYMWIEQDLLPPIGPDGFVPDLMTVHAQGFYVLASYMLTGEERVSYMNWVDPLRPFDRHCPCASPGAWELAFRVSRLRFSDNIFTPGPQQLADPLVSSPGATEFTVGLNWYLNKGVRFMLNWEHDWFDDPVQLGGPGDKPLRTQHTLLARMQLVF